MLQRALWSNAKAAFEDGRSRLIYDLYLPAQLILEPSPQGELRPAVTSLTRSAWMSLTTYKNRIE